MKHTPETRKMAQDVLDFVTFNPHAHDQKTWFDYDGGTPVISEDENICNTTMCIAGTTKFLAEGIEGLKSFENNEWASVNEAGSLLGLDFDEYDALFYTMDQDTAVEMLRAVTNDDEDKFWAIKNSSKSL